MSERVLLTGIAGHIGQHCAAVLPRQGCDVVGAIRSRAKADATRSPIAQIAPVNGLSFAEAGIQPNSGRAKAMTGCTFVMDVASPFPLATPKDENLLIASAVDGSKRVIVATQCACVKRLVPTPSVVMIVAGTESGSSRPVPSRSG